MAFSLACSIVIQVSDGGVTLKFRTGSGTAGKCQVPSRNKEEICFHCPSPFIAVPQNPSSNPDRTEVLQSGFFKTVLRDEIYKHMPQCVSHPHQVLVMTSPVEVLFGLIQHRIIYFSVRCHQKPAYSSKGSLYFWTFCRLVLSPNFPPPDCQQPQYAPEENKLIDIPFTTSLRQLPY